MTPEMLGRIIAGEDIDPMDRLISTLDELAFIVGAVRTVGVRICETNGSFDLAHIGHTRYTRAGWQHTKSYGSQRTLMFVGIEDDEKIQKRKGPNRPVIPFVERVEMMASTRWVDVVIKKGSTFPKWAITKIIKPDVLLAVEGTYKPEQIPELQKICGEVYVVPRQAENSTSAQVRKIQVGGADEFIAVANPLVEVKLNEVIDDLVKSQMVGADLDPNELKRLLKIATDQAIAQAYDQISGRKPDR